MRNIGHYGTGDLEIIIKDEQSYLGKWLCKV